MDRNITEKRREETEMNVEGHCYAYILHIGHQSGIDSRAEDFPQETCRARRDQRR
jgi:hypothetical protein